MAAWLCVRPLGPRGEGAFFSHTGRTGCSPTLGERLTSWE